ncbi:FG-GAP repeat protein [Enhygromyxa salina]|uniref:FG-GAP repeat protein n=1 Tax=Enhygromyxa salina TaxID=215803 RepID=A0A2S9XXG0_9BACT|nr:FG-GAP-like repeat-containing protein [Enhygromyxa salina]PRP97555.1 FG-GAP repeat protein [Enhygromyxa salina]
MSNFPVRELGYACVLVSMIAACGDDRSSAATSGAATGIESDGTGSADGTADTNDGDGDGDPGDGDGDPGDGDTEGPKFDLREIPDNDDTPTGPTCEVVDDMDAIGNCEDTAPPDAFEPDVQWAFMGQDGETQSMATVLVANLTDDNNDGSIDLCDVPEVIVGLFATYSQWTGHLWALDGETGAVVWKSAATIDTTVTPALGDIDGDGVPEIIAATGTHQLIAFENDGSVKWQSDETWNTTYGSFALADVDNDGTPEIIAGNRLHDVDGSVEAAMPIVDPSYSATTAADLDGDGDLEIVMGNAAYHHDGVLLWTTNLDDGYPQVADLDGDGEPEVLLTNSQGLSVIEHDGAIKYQGLRPTGDPASSTVWRRPATIHDFDGDGVPEYAVSSQNHYAVYEADASILWQADVLDSTGIAAGTAFDFDGDSIAEAMYADETNLYVYDGMGMALLDVPRSSGTIVEYPVVADVDNDGSAEIVVVSNTSFDNNQTAPAVQVVRDIEDRWIQARRIWNQHTYHVTNVREDGTIPQFEKPHWELLNTFRTNAQIEAGGVCQPPPQG